MRESFRLMLVALTMSACATAPTLVPFTQELRAQFNLDDQKLRGLQYYVSQPIVLNRDLAQGEATVTPGHGLLITRDRRIEQVKVEPLTPGIADSASETALFVSFEPGQSLRFGAGDDRSGPYVLLAKKWEGDVGDLFYAGKDWKAIGTSGDAKLLVDLKELNRLKVQTRTLPGRKLPTQ
jgi:hypothetical protein